MLIYQLKIINTWNTTRAVKFMSFSVLKRHYTYKGELSGSGAAVTFIVIVLVGIEPD